MAHVLNLTVDSTNYTLTSSPYYLEEYTPIPADGENDVTESATVYIAESSIANLLTRLSELKRVMERARTRQRTQTGDKAYVAFQADGDTDRWRSEILDGRVVYDEGALKYWSNKGVRATLIWTRRFYWEKSTLAQLSLDGGAGETTSPVTIYNHDDTGHGNYVKFWDVEGDIPAPLKIIMRVNDAGTVFSRFYMGVTDVPPYLLSAQYPTDVYEGEDSNGGGTPTVAATASDGNYMARSWTGAVTHTTNLYYWTIPALTQQLGENRWFSVMARFHIDPPADTYARLSLEWPASTPITELWAGPEVLLESNRELQHVGSFPLPPGPDTGTPSDVALVLSVRSPVTSSLNVDYIQLFGPEFLRFDQIGYALDLDDEVTVDGPENSIYVTDSASSTDVYIYHNRGKPPMAYPGRYHIFRALWDDTTGNSDISQSFDVTMWYRPRKLTP